eukprot:jgi/Mesvir1/10789/Mv13844-RA.1
MMGSGVKDMRGEPSSGPAIFAENDEGMENLNLSGDPLDNPPSYAEAVFSPYAEGSRGTVGTATGQHRPGTAVDSDEAYIAGNGREGDRYGDEDSVNGVQKGAPQAPLFPVHHQGPRLMSITVNNPMKVDGNSVVPIPGGGSYITYAVNTRTTLPGFKKPEFSVRRRFRDFVALSDRLAEVYEGYFIPARPDKSVEGQVMMSKEFVEMRAQALEKYMNQLAAHPVLSTSEILKNFLESEGDLASPSIAAAPSFASRMLDGASRLPKQLFGADAARSSGAYTPESQQKSGVGIFRMFKELTQSIASELGAGTKVTVQETDEDFIARRNKAGALEKQLAEASAKAEALVRAQQAVGDVTGEFGLSLIKVAKFEEASASSITCQNLQVSHATDARLVGMTSVRISRVSREAMAKTVEQLNALHDHLSIMSAVRSAVACREESLQGVQALVADLDGKRGRLGKLEAQSSQVFGGDKTRSRKVSDLAQEVERTAAAKEAAERKFATIQERNRSEFARLDAERARDFASMLIGFAHTQAAYADMCAEIWRSAADVFEGIKNSEAAVASLESAKDTA